MCDDRGCQAMLAIPTLFCHLFFMAERIAPIRKTPVEILADLINGHNEALRDGAEKGRKYLLNFHDRNNSIPNGVKFFLYDLLAEDAYRSNDLETCRTAMTKASGYLSAARTEMQQSFREYSASVRLFDRGIAMAVDDGEFEKALSLCDQAIALDLGGVYAAKRASIERML